MRVDFGSDESDDLGLSLGSISCYMYATGQITYLLSASLLQLHLAV